MKIFSKNAVTQFLTPLLCMVALSGAPAGLALAAEPSKASAQAQSEPMDLNQITAEQLASLPGIGKKKAEAIIAYRDEMGHFIEVAQLTEVKGIGPKLLAKIESRLRVVR